MTRVSDESILLKNVAASISKIVKLFCSIIVLFNSSNSNSDIESADAGSQHWTQEIDQLIKWSLSSGTHVIQSSDSYCRNDETLSTENRKLFSQVK